MKDTKKKKKENDVKPETVFDLGAEGGRITIFRQREGSVNKYIIYHNEFDPFDDDKTLVDVRKEYETFKQAFHDIDSQYSWYSFYIMSVHKDYRDFIIQRLNEILIEKSTSTDPSDYNRDRDIEDIKENLSRSVSEWDDRCH